MISRYGSQALAAGARPGARHVGGVGGPESVDTPSLLAGFGAPESVDTIGCGRFWRQRYLSWRPNRDPGRAQVPARRLAPDARRVLDLPERPPQSPKGQYLLSFLVAQDVGHPGGGPQARRLRQRPGALHQLAGFQVSITGRFWVSTEGGTLGIPE